MSSLSPLITVGHFWSLAVEEQFYLIWPILLLLASRRGQVRGLCLGVFLVSLIFRICSFGLHLNPGWAGFFIVGRAGEMAAGGFLAASLRCSEREMSQVLRGAIPLLVASGVGVMAVILWTKETGAGDPWFGTVGIALLTQLFMALIALCLKPGMTQRIFAFSLLRWLGKISYGIYVYHLLLYPFFAWVAHRILPTSGGQSYLFVLAAVAMVGTLSAAWFSFTFVESRFLRLRSASVAPACSAHP
jgi:peptidoglycan/LPS O-acetylase OafA/YrhL